jgi:hypothetical protein
MYKGENGMPVGFCNHACDAQITYKKASGKIQNQRIIVLKP